MEKKFAEEKVLQELETARHDVSRRHFLQLAGGFAGLGVLLAACNKTTNNNGPYKNGTTLSLGSGDTGILNYAYVLEQIEAAFYIQVTNTPYSGMSSSDKALLMDIMYHEVAHRDFLKVALGSSVIHPVTPDFSSINFSDRTSVLAAARTFEDLGVAAYNGIAANFTTSPSGTAYLTIAGKIVSVEGRHAATIHDMIAANSFADDTIADANGLEYTKTPAQVLAIASAYIEETIDASGIM